MLASHPTMSPALVDDLELWQIGVMLGIDLEAEPQAAPGFTLDLEAEKASLAARAEKIRQVAESRKAKGSGH